MNYHNFVRRAATLLPAALLAGALGACDSVLSVENPGAVLDEQLSDSLNATLLVNTVTSDFQRMYDDLARNGGWLTDELVSGHNFIGYREWDARIIKQERTELGDVYTVLHRARFSADSLAGRYAQMFPQRTPSQNLNLARMRAYGGYSYIMLGEYFCESPLKPDEGAVPSAELTKGAIPRFEAAIQAATAAKSGTGAVPAARADSIINLSNLGLARVYLQLGDKAKAREFAAKVPANFEFRAFYSDSKDYQENVFYSATTGANMNVGVDIKFRNLNDRRVLHTATSRTGHNGTTQLFRPYQAPSFSGWKATGDTVQFAKNTSIRFASGLEARYILAEAGGMNDGELLSFINERRAVGGQAALTELPADAQAEVRDQRRRDFFLDGHRLGDMRRYKAQYQIDEFPTGPHPDASMGTYGTAECFIPTLGERMGNPKY